MSKWFSVFISAISLLSPVISPGTVSAEEPPTQLVISHVKLNDKTDQNQGVVQSVGIYNASDEKLKLEGWTLEYAKPAFDATKCGLASWEKTASGTEGYNFALTGEIEPRHTFVFVPPNGVNKTTEGSLRIMSPESNGVRTQHDLVGWGSEAKPSKCFETEQAGLPGDNNLLTRCLDDDGSFRDTNNNAQDFSVVIAAGYTAPMCLKDEPKVDAAQCENVAITEVLPNPAGTDSGHEFIEIHNPTDDVLELHGCGLATSEGKEFTFAAGAELAAGEYRVLYDDDTGIGLTNSKSVGLMVVTADEEFLQTSYPADLGDDVAWALISGTWQETDNPTPGAPNQPMTPEEASVSGGDEELASCPAGKFRNPLTNRCKSIVLATAALTPCKPGQTRNPETNRCRGVATVTSSLTPCKADQERNPETNRCRKVASASTLKPCGPDEERNPDTNRCRKVQASLASADADAKQDSGKSAVNYGILGLVGTSAIGYGVYEYRNDLRNKFAVLKTRFFPDNSGK